MCELVDNMHKYERIIFWSEDDSKWIVDVPELAGCMADGNTPTEALENVEKVIEDWIETAEMLGRDIPIPKGRLVFA
jgi:predicted RNase H-like HicB family nuclease